MDAMKLYFAEDPRRIPSFDMPDPSVVTETTLAHPSPQCRLDTQLAAMLCSLSFDFGRIPGLGADGKGRNTPKAEAESYRHVCGPQHINTAARRPQCWFAPLHRESAIVLGHQQRRLRQ